MLVFDDVFFVDVDVMNVCLFCGEDQVMYCVEEWCCVGFVEVEYDEVGQVFCFESFCFEMKGFGVVDCGYFEGLLC